VKSSTTTQTSETDSNNKPPKNQTKVTNQTQTGANVQAGDPVLTAALTDVNGLYDSFMNSLLQVNSATGVIGRASVVQGCELANLIKGTQKDDGTGDSPAFILLASVLSAGGTEHDHKSLWTALTHGDEITYSGGAIVNVSVWKADTASPIYADVLRYRAPFANVSNPASTEGVDAGDNLPWPATAAKKQ
jgi:hypothetical protein